MNKTLSKLITKYNQAKTYNDSIGFNISDIKVYTKTKTINNKKVKCFNPAVIEFFKLYPNCKLDKTKKSIIFYKPDKTTIKESPDINYYGINYNYTGCSFSPSENKIMFGTGLNNFNKLTPHEQILYISDSLTHEHMHKAIFKLKSGNISQKYKASLIFDLIEENFRNNLKITYKYLNIDSSLGRMSHKTYISIYGLDSWCNRYYISKNEIKNITIGSDIKQLDNNIHKQLIDLSNIFKNGFTVILKQNKLNQYNNTNKPYIVSITPIITISKRNKDLIIDYYNIPLKNNIIIGGWMDDSNNIYYIELNKSYKNKYYALKIAKRYKQKYIYDINNNKCISVK